ncbi:hypothetical protein GA715_09390 [Leuconostoc mesenteroides]|nr:hypothetical protein [Leuconostoc mesenteroides]
MPVADTHGHSCLTATTHPALLPIFGPRILKRLQRLFVDHPDGLSESGHDWYFGYLVCAYTQTHFGIKNLLNYPSVTKELFSLCLTQLSD